MANDEKEKKKKMPKNSGKPSYPYCTATQTMSGHEIIIDDTKGNEYTRTAHCKGSFKDLGSDGAKRELVVHTEHKAVSQGSSSVVEGPFDWLFSNHGREVHDQTHHTEIGGDVSKAAGAKQVSIFGDAGFSYHKSSVAHTTDGQHFTMVTKGNFYRGHESSNNQGDDKGHDINFSQGVRYDYHDGEHGQYTIGNSDKRVEGKFQAHSTKEMKINTDDTMAVHSKKDMTTSSNASMSIKADSNVSVKASEDMTINGKTITITADDTLILKVGGSKITIKSSGIEIESSGDIKTQGLTTKIQGGGTIAPPATFQ